MKHMCKRLLLLVLALCLMAAMLPAAAATVPNGEKICYGYSGEGRELIAYRFGNGSHVMVLGFALHGFEDNFYQDGKALVYTAEQLMASLKKSNLAAQHGWTVYVLPCMNPDGLYSGYSHNGPGRCTTRRFDADGKLMVGGIDLNRCFPVGFTPTFTSRNYTGSTPLGCPEAKALSEFIQRVKGNSTNILVDTHGWYQQIIVHTDTEGLLYQAFHRNFPKNVHTYSGKAHGYLTEYAYSLGYDTCLFEFPDGLFSMDAFKKSGYCEKYIASIETILKSVPEVCAGGHDFEITRTEPTCTASGKEEKTCKRCGDIQTRTLQALGHAYTPETTKVLQEQTATRDGYISQTCTRCGRENTLLSGRRVFLDTKGTEYYADAVDYAYAHGLVNGVSSDAFGPDVNLTRGMLVTILHRLEGNPAASAKAPFSDVKPDQYFAEAVDWAFENGIVNGMSDRQFAPNELVTRQQTAAILFRYVTQLGKDNSLRAAFSGFTDANRVDDYARNAMAWCVGNGIINGVSATRLDPRGYATRAQSLVMLYRVVQYLCK